MFYDIIKEAYGEYVPLGINDLYGLLRALIASRSGHTSPVYCILPIDTQNLSWVIANELAEHSTKFSQRRDKVIIFSGNSFILKIPDTYDPKWVGEPIAKVISSYVKYRGEQRPKILFSVRKSKPSWFTTKRIFAVIAICAGLNDIDIDSIISWAKENSIPRILLLEDALFLPRVSKLSEGGCHILGFDRSDFNEPKTSEDFLQKTFRIHSMVKSVKPRLARISKETGQSFQQARQTLIQLGKESSENQETSGIIYLFRILLRKLEATPCNLELCEPYFSGFNKDSSIRTNLDLIENSIESYKGLGKALMYAVLSLVGQIYRDLSSGNPGKFAEIINEINNSIAARRSLGVMFSSRAHIYGFRKAVEKSKHFINQHELTEKGIQLLDPSSVIAGMKFDRVLIVSDFPHNAQYKGIMKIESSEIILLHYPGESNRLATDSSTSIQLINEIFNNSWRERQISNIMSGLNPERPVLKSEPLEEGAEVLANGETPEMPDFFLSSVGKKSQNYRIQSNENSTNNRIPRVLEILCSDGKYLFVTENSSIRVLLTDGTIQTKRANELNKGDQLIMFRDSIVISIYGTIKEELKNWDPRALKNFTLVEMWKSQLKNAILENNIKYPELLGKLVSLGSMVSEETTVKNWIAPVDDGGVIGPLDKHNLNRLTEIFPEYFNKLPIEELYSAITWVRGLPKRLLSISEKVILAKEFGEDDETEQDLLFYDIGKGLELKLVSNIRFLVD